MPTVPVAQNRLGIASISNAKIQPADLSGTGAEALGAGLQSVAKGMDQFAEHLHQVDLNEQTSDFANNFAKARLAFDEQRIDARANAGPGAAGHTEAMEKAWGDLTAPLLANIKNPEIRRRAEEQINSSGVEAIGNEYGFEVKSKTDKILTDTDGMVNSASARVRVGADPGVYLNESTTLDKTIGDLSLSDDLKQKLWKQAHAKLAGARIGNLIDTNPSVAIAEIDKGAFNDVLDGAQLDSYRAQADVGVRRIASEQQHQLALAKSAFSEQVATVKAQLGAGVQVPDTQLAALADQAKTFGDTSNAFDLSEARVRNNFNQLSKGWTPQQWDTHRNTLLAKGTKRTPQEDILLDQIEKRMPSAVEDFNKDPGKWASINGVAPPAIDFNKRATLDARRNWVATVSKATGRPTPFFSPNEIADFKAKAEASPAGEAAVINQVALIDGNADRTGGMGAMREMLRILPDDPKAARLVLLNPSVRGSAMAGMAVLKERPDTLPDKLTRQPFMDRLGAAGALMDGTQLEGVYGVAKGIYVDMAQKQGIGLGKDTAFDQNLWNSALHRALGGRYDGSSNKWFGGVWTWGKDSVLIPNTITGKQFEGAMTGLRTQRWDERDKSVPVYSDGKTVMQPPAVAAMVPVLRPDGRYEFHGPNGTVAHTKSGGIFLMDLATVAKRYPQ